MHKRKRFFNIFDTSADFEPYLWPKKDKIFCPVFVFRRGMCNAICDLVLYPQSQDLNIS